MAGWPRRRIARELLQELDREPNWMYAWPLSGDRWPTLLNAELESVHATRAEMIEPAVRAVLGESPGASAIDLACSEG